MQARVVKKAETLNVRPDLVIGGEILERWNEQVVLVLLNIMILSTDVN